MKGSALLLIVLGVLFSIPIAAKTFSAHGAVPALLSGLLVAFIVCIGPLAFLANSIVKVDIFGVVPISNNLGFLVVSAFGVVLVLAWVKLQMRSPRYPIPYLPVTAWALTGALFCVQQIFAHIIV